MGAKIIKALLLLLLFFLSAIIDFADASDLVRVGLTDNKFQNILRQEVKDAYDKLSSVEQAKSVEVYSMQKTIVWLF